MALNPALYARLQRSYGKVRIANPGAAFRYTPTFDHEHKPRISIATEGEYYQVCCPFCRDTRFRLYVNHMWGKPDAHGRRMMFLAYCFNESCLDREENRRELMERIDDNGWLEHATISVGVEEVEAEEVDWPGPCTPLTELDDRHPSRSYLLSRQIDPDTHAAKYDLRYCTDSKYRYARDRIIIPVYEGGQLKGWQARYLGELPWKDKSQNQDLPPKYYSCPSSRFRSNCVYGLDQMRRWHTGVIVEGPTDRWRLGAFSGCVFGNTVTPPQTRKLLEAFTGRKNLDRALILMLDPEEMEKKATVNKVLEFERKMLGRFCTVSLPEGTDPGSLDREFLREYIRQKAAERGVTVQYRKVLT